MSSDRHEPSDERRAAALTTTVDVEVSEESEEPQRPDPPDPAASSGSTLARGPGEPRRVPSSERSRVPARLGRYRLEGRLGTGGMGEVFAAREPETGDVVALKILSTTTATRLFRFKREFRALVDLSHRNLVRLYELVVPDMGPAFFTMELLEGRPFVDWVRGSTPLGEPPDPDRLEHGLRQLVDGVHHLHAHGCIHRDLKPSNVLVTAEGRVVVLDFGLVSEQAGSREGITHDRQVVGTPSYMAPEQARGEPVGPAADYYAVGVMLFECLTGRLPYEGAPLQQLMAKQLSAVEPTVDLVAAPPQLRGLCARLLARDPDARPRGPQLLSRLRVSHGARHEAAARTADVLVGRETQLQRLRAAFGELGESARAEAVVVHVRGRSGDGKSALVRRFRSERQGAGAVVLHGRCREQETVPYKGIDAVVDALSAHLRRLPKDELTPLRPPPPDLDALVRVFGVMGEIWLGSRSSHGERAGAHALGTATLRKLLRSVAARRPLVVHIDDVQWADLDSVRLLEALLRPPEAPALLLVLSYRSEAEGSAVLGELRGSEVLAGPTARTIDLPPLSADDARDLAHSLLEAVEPSVRSTQAETIAIRSRGSPFFIVRMAMSGPVTGTTDSDLDRVVVRSLGELDDPARRLLEVVAVFGGPLPVEFACAQSLSTAEAVDSLCAQGLLVRGDHDHRTLDRIETAHDRVREVVLAELGLDAKLRLHRQIGRRLLEQYDGGAPDTTPFAIVDHLVAGHRDLSALPRSDRLRLARLAAEAGQRALEPGAWSVAHRYFGVAHQLLTPWQADARRGGGEHAVCVAVAFGLAQAELALGTPRGHEAMDELLGWSLTLEEHGRIARWYCSYLSLTGDFARTVELGVQALRQIGYPVPSRPSWIGALWSYAWGWRSLWWRGLDRIRTLPMGTDERGRIGMDIAAITSLWSADVDPKLHLTMLGAYSRRLPAVGLHDWVGVGLVGWAGVAVLRRRTGQARALLDLVEHLCEHPEIPELTRYATKAAMIPGLLVVRPFGELVARFEQVYRRASEIAPRGLVEWTGMFCAHNHYLASTPLPQLVDFLDLTEAQSGGFVLDWVRSTVEGYRRYIGALTRDATTRTTLDGSPAHLDSRPTSVVRIVREVESAVLLGDHEAAWALMASTARTYRRSLGRFRVNIPIYAMFGVVVITERWSTSSGAERALMRAMSRALRSAASRWASRCPENYQPMLDVIEAELAARRGRYERAMTAYERARSAAFKRKRLRIVGLASERLAKLARQRGHALLAEGAFEAARDAYVEWGATAVVRRLDRECAAERTAEREAVGAAGPEGRGRPPRPSS